MANLPIKKKYSIWQTLREGGFYRVFKCPDHPNMWGEEKKLTYKHNLITKIYVNIAEGNRHLGRYEFDNFDEALIAWEKVYGEK